MGFSCSPMWCNLYFMAYEICFISRLILLRRFDLLDIFEQAYRYNDDICVLNAPSIDKFLDPDQDRSSDNPWWIYPLGLMEIKPEITSTRFENPNWGIDVHFLSIRVMIFDIIVGSYIYDRKIRQKENVSFPISTIYLLSV